MTNPIRAIMFDLDGTLADTIGDIGGAVNSVLAAHGFPEHSIDSYKIMVGNGFSMLMKRALPPEAANDDGRFPALLREASSLYARRALDTTAPFPGMPETLAALRGKGVLCAVLSNKPDEMTKKIVAALFPGIPFLAVAGDRPGAPRKPDPAGALAIAALSGIPPENWAFVGDSGVDMETGAASGMTPLGASWGYRSVQELSGHGAAKILREPADLLACL